MEIKEHIHVDACKHLKQRSKNKNKDKRCAFHNDYEHYIEHYLDLDKMLHNLPNREALVDTRSFLDVMIYKCFLKLGLKTEDTILIPHLIMGLTKYIINPKGMVKLSIEVGIQRRRTWVVGMNTPLAHSLEVIAIGRFLKLMKLNKFTHTRFLTTNKAEKLVFNNAAIVVGCKIESQFIGTQQPFEERRKKKPQDNFEVLPEDYVTSL
ncbi:hypothetical protein Cgig2_028070 [Carnegiea gigantea]|uniref:Uncharacterized protein n=1 Tax=Carnegiea gigantea TaxID=171969 RepID=A0A9Q1GS59_9CARY|nr:hypothetical protein Cgig2_028070 [Carnegiea gigantea]